MGNTQSQSQHQYGGFSSKLPAEVNHMFKSYMDVPTLATASSIISTW